ncbi:MAG: hypothetical protein Q9225_003634 [Loekoesia sp. 1 TL-2023]
MASFLTDLLTSIFTPGPTHSILVATNVSFAALQTVLFILLLLIQSVHFIVLSILCAGLWWSINWFAAELEVARHKEKEQEFEKLDETQQQQNDSSGEDSGTETEGGDDPATTVNKKPIASTLPLAEDAEINLRRRRSLGSSTGNISTDSEWDKVEEADAHR